MSWSKESYPAAMRLRLGKHGLRILSEVANGNRYARHGGAALHINELRQIGCLIGWFVTQLGRDVLEGK